MSSSVRRLRLVLALAAALCLAAPLVASAATTRYASPDGTGASPCVQVEPCSLETALSEAGPIGLAGFDTVLLAPGTYRPVGELKIFSGFVTVAGEPGKPAPLIEVAAGERGLFFQTTATIRDLRIHSTMATIFALTMIGPESVIEQVESTGEASRACVIGEIVIRDSVCSATPSFGSGEGVELSIAGPPSVTEARLINVTAVGGRAGIAVATNTQSSVILDATNTIAAGETADVYAGSFATTAPIAINLSHSNFVDVETEGPGAISVTSSSAAGNQTAPPLFFDEAGGDYREQAASPTRLAGDLGAVLPGELDLAGNPRTTNCAGTVGVDIGAYQYECPAPEPPPAGPRQPKDETKPEPQRPCTCALGPPPRPGLTKLALKPAKFTTTGKAPKGTTISYFLSTGATVKIEVLGTKTVKGKQKTVPLGSLPHAPGHPGTNSVKFNGKLKGKALEPGKYTLQVLAAGPGGSAKPATKVFTVLAATG